MRPYEGYDDVLQRYSDWLLTLRDKNLIVVDAHEAVSSHVAEVRKTDPKYRLSGDGVHVDGAGHWLIAQAILQAWDAPADVDTAVINAASAKQPAGEVSNLSVHEDGALGFTWRTRLPMPADPAWNDRVAETEKIADRLNRQRLTVKDAPREKYELYEGDKKLGEVGRDQLAAGLDMTRFKDLSTNVRAAKLGKLASERSHLLGLAWLTDVGHKRPDTPKGIPLEDAQKQAAEMEKEIRKLAEPQKIMLRLVPLEK